MSGPATEQSVELAELRARVADLERELADRTQHANDAIAAAQARIYWLDRWNIDLDELMKRRGAQRALQVARQARRARRAVGRLRRRLRR